MSREQITGSLHRNRLSVLRRIEYDLFVLTFLTEQQPSYIILSTRESPSRFEITKIGIPVKARTSVRDTRLLVNCVGRSSSVARSVKLSLSEVYIPPALKRVRL